MIQTRCFSRDERGGKIRDIFGLHPTQVNLGAGWVDVNPNFGAGDVNLPHLVTGAPLMTSVAEDGMRRIHPTHELDKYFEIGPPYLKPSTNWAKVNLGAATRSKNLLSWQTPNADVNIYHGGHFLKLEIPLKGGWQPPNGQFAFPIGLTGLTRKGTDIYDGDKLVMHMRPPVAYDAANRMDTRPIASELVKVGSQNYILFKLPDLAGMASPVIDPTFSIQPDAAAGKDAAIYSSTPNTNYGTDVTIDAIWNPSGASKVHGLFQFDVSPILASAIVLSGIFSWTCRANLPGGEVGVHSITRTWTEAGVTWNTYDGANGWAAAGGDFTPAASGSVNPASYGIYTVYDFPIPVLVQAWIRGVNYGMIGKGETESGTVFGLAGHSSDAVNAAYRPKLVVEYSFGNFVVMM